MISATSAPSTPTLPLVHFSPITTLSENCYVKENMGHSDADIGKLLNSEFENCSRKNVSFFAS
jgi:hypothetical protein